MALHPKQTATTDMGHRDRGASIIALWKRRLKRTTTGDLQQLGTPVINPEQELAAGHNRY
uniref:Uncharacterized protein n=1 Tax=Arundo donax TaxID=35708 RepID=A0A0A9H2I2_ARUDO